MLLSLSPAWTSAGVLSLPSSVKSYFINFVLNTEENNQTPFENFSFKITIPVSVFGKEKPFKYILYPGLWKKKKGRKEEKGQLTEVLLIPTAGEATDFISINQNHS